MGPWRHHPDRVWTPTVRSAARASSARGVYCCSSPQSRNFSFGARLGQGMTVEQAQAAAHGQVAEGAKSCISIADLARRVGVEMPLTEAVRAVCYDGVPVSRAMDDLLNRDVGGEWRPKDVD